jgi:ATP-dependent RNA helicase DeaD
MVTKTFRELGLSAEITKALRENGFEVPFPIQEATIPLILEGNDVIGQAHTGTGKTAAFALPILAKLKHSRSIQALILVPTRELAVQVTNEINKFSRYTGFRTVAIYGGQSIGIQHDQIRRGVQIVVATPGRLIDHIKHGSVRLENVKFVVLDEADRMLDMGFIDDIKFILFYVEKEGERQTCLFSATMPPEILRLAQEYMKDAKEIRLNEEELSLNTIEQSYLVVPEKEKFKHLCYFIKNRDKKQTIVFAATKQRTQRLVDDLLREGFKANTIHGDLSQKQRNNSINRFKKGVDDILVATDIAARGIDVPAVGYVINYDIPEDPLIYFHRIGRTARAGGTGKAISLVSQDRLDNFGRILRRTEQSIRKLNDEMGIATPVVRQRIGRSGPYHQRHGYSGNNTRYSKDESTRGGYRGNSKRRWGYGERKNNYHGGGRRDARRGDGRNTSYREHNDERR